MGESPELELTRVFRDDLDPVPVRSLAEKDALAEQAEARAAVHLAFGHLRLMLPSTMGAALLG